MADFTDMEWRITVMDSTTTVEEFKIPQQQLSEEKLKHIMELLAARNLSPDEIIGSAVGNAKLLEVGSDTTRGNRLTYWSGQNPHYVAGLFRKDE